MLRDRRADNIRDALSAFYNNAVNGNSGCNHCNTVMILPKEIKMSVMEAILRFIYDGQVEVKVDCIESFLKLLVRSTSKACRMSTLPSTTTALQ